MKHLRAYLYIIGLTLMVAVMAACSVSYKFNGASIDYTKTKTIQIADFPIRSSYVWGPMGPMFNNEIKDKFASNTQLIQVSRNGDLKIEGEITHGMISLPTPLSPMMSTERSVGATCRATSSAWFNPSLLPTIL